MSVHELAKNKDWIEIITNASLFLFLLAKTGVMNLSIIEYSSLAIFILLIGYKIFVKKTITITKQSVYYSLFGSFACVSYLWASSKEFAADSIPSIVALMIFIIAVSNYINSPDKFLKLVKYTVITNVIVSLKIILLYNVYSGTIADRINQITGIYFNTVAQVIGFSILFCIYLYKVSGQKRYMAMIIPQFLAIFLTESRKALIIPILGIAIIMLLEKKTLKKLVLYFGIVLVLVLSTVVLANSNTDIANSITGKFEELFRYATGKETEDWSINLRQFFIDTGIEVFKEKPITGIGLNNFAYHVANNTEYGVARYSHNNYIELLSCLGLLGFVLYYWFYLYVLFNLFKHLIKNRDNILVIIAFAAITVLMIMEWGIVSYTGCMYHIYILMIYYTLEYKEKILIENRKEKNNAKQN